MAQDFFDEVKDHAKKQGLDHMGVSLIERHSVSFTTRFWNTFWSQRTNASGGTDRGAGEICVWFYEEKQEFNRHEESSFVFWGVGRAQERERRC